MYQLAKCKKIQCQLSLNSKTVVDVWLEGIRSCDVLCHKFKKYFRIFFKQKLCFCILWSQKGSKTLVKTPPNQPGSGSDSRDDMTVFRQFWKLAWIQMTVFAETHHNQMCSWTCLDPSIIPNPPRPRSAWILDLAIKLPKLEVFKTWTIFHAK